MRVTGAAGPLGEGWDGGICAVHALSPAAFTSSTFLKGKKPSIRNEIALERISRLAEGFELCKGIPPQQPVRSFPCILLTDKRKLWKTHKDYCVSMAITRSSLTVEVNSEWQHCTDLGGPSLGPGPATPLLQHGLARPGLDQLGLV